MVIYRSDAGEKGASVADIITGGSIMKWKLEKGSIYEGERFIAHPLVSDGRRLVNAMNIARNAVACNITIDRLLKSMEHGCVCGAMDPEIMGKCGHIKLEEDLKRLKAMNERDAI